MKYAETEMLLAVMEGRRADAIRLALDFMPKELLEFRRQVADLAELLRQTHLGDWRTAEDLAVVYPKTPQ